MSAMDEIRKKLEDNKAKKQNIQTHTNSDTMTIIKQSANLLRLSGQLEQLKQDIVSLTEVRDQLLADVEVLEKMKSE